MKSDLLGMDEIYKENSLAQYQCHELAKQYLLDAAAKADTNKKIIKIGVFGCGPGDNDIVALKKYYLSEILSKNKNINFQIFMIDIAENDWSKKEHYYPNISIIGITSDIYKIILPENSLDLVISFSCLHWLNQIPFDITNEFSWSDLNKNKRNILSDHLDKSLNQFLHARKHELSKNGKMILSFDADNNLENHQYQGPTDCLVKIIKNLKLQKELNNFFIPTAPRQIGSVKKCFQETKINLCNIELIYVECPIWDKYIMNNNDQMAKYIFAEEINNSIQSCIQPILKKFLNDDYLELINHEMIQYISNNSIKKNSTAGNIIISYSY